MLARTPPCRLGWPVSNLLDKGKTKLSIGEEVTQLDQSPASCDPDRCRAPIERPSSGTVVHSRSPPTPTAAAVVSSDPSNGYFGADVAHSQLLSGATHSTINWGCPPLPLAYSLDVKPITDTLNGSYSSVISTSSADSIAVDGAIMSDAAYTEAATKSLLGMSAGGAYYGTTSSVYQPGAYATVQGSPLYGSTQNYYQRALKGSTASYPLGPYFGAATGTTSNYYGSAYSGSATTPLEYGTYGYPQYYPNNCYYGSAGLSVSGQVPSTTATYQLTQLPPCTTLSDPTCSSAGIFTPNDIASFVKPETKKSKSKKKKAANPSPSPENQYERVFIWDLDDVCVLTDALTSGSYAHTFSKDAHVAAQLGHSMERLVFDVIRLAFRVDDVDFQEWDQGHIDDAASDEAVQDLTGYNLSSDGLQLAVTSGASLCLGAPSSVRGGVDWMRKLALRYRHIRELYTCFKDRVPELLRTTCSPERCSQWLSLQKDIEILTDGWTQKAERCLQVVASSRPRPERYANVLLSGGHLVQTLAKVMLTGLAPSFPIENIYSTTKSGREACIERVRNRFGKKCAFVIIGSSHESKLVADKEGIPFWRVSSPSDLEAFYHALNHHLLGT
uniref:Eyes absent homolog n=1 Tax=Plectus sambesii TaxID=2011161 RepID=A0A914X3X8_9BILA